MRILIAIDDTDTIDSRGTGEVAELLAAGIMANDWGRCGEITRHQLLLHPDIPYTSHNSAMCFPADISGDLLDRVTNHCATALAAESETGSDPGLCIMVPEWLARPDMILDYGYRAKTAVVSKHEAYETAATHGVHLSEHGGTGQGVIGALAGAALRLSGNDGRFRGKLSIPSRCGTTIVGDIRCFGIEVVQTLEGVVLDDGQAVHVGQWVKPVLMNNRTVLLVVAENGIPGAAWKACDRKIFKDY